MIVNYLHNRNFIKSHKFILYQIHTNYKSHLNYIYRIEISNFIILRKFIINLKKNQKRVIKKVFIDYKNDYIYYMLLSNDNIIRSFKIV